MKFVFILEHWSGLQGLSAITAIKINYWTNLGHEVHLVVRESAKRDEGSFNLPPSVQIHELHNYRHNAWGISNPLMRLLALRKIDRSYQQAIIDTLKIIQPTIIIVAHSAGAEYGVAAYNGPCVKVFESHEWRHYHLEELNCRYAHRSDPNSLKNRISRSLGLYSYHSGIKKQNNVLKSFDSVVLLSNAHIDNWKPLQNIAVIPNTANLYKSYPLSSSTNKRVIAVGRLHYIKNFKDLIEAWALLPNEFNDWTLEIVGDGDERENLCQAIVQNGLSGRVFLSPQTQNINAHYTQASILALTSRSEGFGMVIIEAMSMGLPIVSYDCPHGPKSIITNGIDGYITPYGDKHTLANSLVKLMGDLELRTRMGAAAQKTSHKYLPENVMPMWKELFNKLLSQKNLGKL